MNRFSGMHDESQNRLQSSKQQMLPQPRDSAQTINWSECVFRETPCELPYDGMGCEQCRFAAHSSKIN